MKLQQVRNVLLIREDSNLEKIADEIIGLNRNTLCYFISICRQVSALYTIKIKSTKQITVNC